MDQYVNVLLAIDKAYRAPPLALDYKPDFGGVQQVYRPQPFHSPWLEYLWKI